MDKLDLLNTPPGRLNLGVDSAAKQQQERIERLRAQAADSVVKENQRAASDSVEISAEALELLKSLPKG